MSAVNCDDQRRMSDDDFLDHLRLPGAAGRALATARRTGDTAAVHRAVAGHFRTRRTPAWVFYMHGGAWLSADGRGDVIAKARNLLRGRFANCWRPYQTVDISRPGGGVDLQAGLRVNGGTIARNTFIPELTTAFALTGDAAYLRRALELIRAVEKQMPFMLEPIYHDDNDRGFGGPGNSAMDIAYRVYRWLDLMYSGALHVPGVFSDRDIFRLIWFYTRQFHRQAGHPLRRDNHHHMDHGHGPWILGLMFPEFAGARRLRRALDRLPVPHCLPLPPSPGPGLRQRSSAFHAGR
ncbi:MAG: hypothetical protein ABIF71_07180 [Planctomycetota bacterium]